MDKIYSRDVAKHRLVVINPQSSSGDNKGPNYIAIGPPIFPGEIAPCEGDVSESNGNGVSDADFDPENLVKRDREISRPSETR